MTWAAFVFVALWLGYFLVWALERGRLRGWVAGIAATWRKFPRGQAVIMSLLFLWAVRVGGTKEGGEGMGGEYETQQFEDFVVQTNGGYSASFTSTNFAIIGIGVTNGIVDLDIQPASGSVYRVDLLYKEFLTNTWWTLAGTTEEAMSAPFRVQVSCTMTSVFFCAGNADVDTDSEGIPNVRESLIYGTDPFKSDTDGEGLSDYAELFTYTTDPLKRDTDGDGMDDDEEVRAETDPTNPNSGGGSATSVRFYYDDDDRLTGAYAGAGSGGGAGTYANTPAGNTSAAERRTP